MNTPQYKKAILSVGHNRLATTSEDVYEITTPGGIYIMLDYKKIIHKKGSKHTDETVLKSRFSGSREHVSSHTSPVENIPEAIRFFIDNDLINRQDILGVKTRRYEDREDVIQFAIYQTDNGPTEREVEPGTWW